ncbi:MAG: chemotaxis protein CheX [Clostridiaceae bacterium]|nr:chemotaxis protein CheX [Clostridiaceae bacterium]
MNVEYINPFIEASQSVLAMMTGNKPELGKVYIRKSPFASDNVAVIVGLTGTIRGQVIISLNKDSAIAVASAMMGGMPITELDDISKSAIAELANMIMGNTATILAAKGTGIEITPPSLLMGDNLTIAPSNMETVSIPLKLWNDNTMEIDVSLETKKA